MMTVSNQATFAKISSCGLQEEVNSPFRPCCCIKFGAQIHQTFGYQGTTLKSMSFAELIKG